MTDFLRYLDEEYRVGIQDSQETWKTRAKSLLTTASAPLERRKAAGIAGNHFGELKLHIGCGDTYLQGWINIDLARPGKRHDLHWDLRRGLPFPDGSVKTIFSEHLFEHIPVSDGLRLLRECRRTLAVDGLIRIGVPDLGRYIKGYLQQDSIIEDVRPGRATRALALSEVFYFFGHRAMYDSETLALLLDAAGFSNIAISEFGQGKIIPCPDSISRKLETLYVEAQPS